MYGRVKGFAVMQQSGVAHSLSPVGVLSLQPRGPYAHGLSGLGVVSMYAHDNHWPPRWACYGESPRDPNYICTDFTGQTPRTFRLGPRGGGRIYLSGMGCCKQYGLSGLGDWTDYIGGLNLTTILGLGAVAFIGYKLLFGHTGKARRSALAKARGEYNAKKRAILAKYPRTSFYPQAA